MTGSFFAYIGGQVQWPDFLCTNCIKAGNKLCYLLWFREKPLDFAKMYGVS